MARHTTRAAKSATKPRAVRAERLPRVLVTAFEPFGGETVNPSLESLRQLIATPPSGCVLVTAELPVRRFEAVDRLFEAVATQTPDAVVMLGQAGGRFRITPERVAINLEDFAQPDHLGERPVDVPIIPGGPAAYFSTLPLRAMCEALQRAHIPCEISNTAGTYLCNRLFYCLMHRLAEERLPVRAGFVHVPFLLEQALHKPWDCPGLSRDTLFSGIRSLVEVVAADVQPAITL